MQSLPSQEEETILLIEFGEVLLLGVPGVFGVGLAYTLRKSAPRVMWSRERMALETGEGTGVFDLHGKDRETKFGSQNCPGELLSLRFTIGPREVVRGVGVSRDVADSEVVLSHEPPTIVVSCGVRVSLEGRSWRLAWSVHHSNGLAAR
jgi:hypothetical protein